LLIKIVRLDSDMEITVVEEFEYDIHVRLLNSDRMTVADVPVWLEQIDKAKKEWEAAKAECDKTQHRLEKAVVELCKIEMKMERLSSGESGCLMNADYATERLYGEVREAVRQLKNLQKVQVGNARDLKFCYEELRMTLMDKSKSDCYRPEALFHFASEGVVCRGHRVKIEYIEDGEVETIDLIELDAPLKKEAHQKRVGQTVDVLASGGRFQCKILGLEVIE
jgi:hypothetical protein